MSADLESQILRALAARNYKPLTPQALARRLGLPKSQYGRFRSALKELVRQGRAQYGKNNTVRAAEPHGTAVGIFRRISPRAAVVRPHPGDPSGVAEVYVPAHLAKDASTDDEVLVKLLRKPAHGREASGEVIQVLERATRQFVGTYLEREGQGYVRVAGTVFSHSIWVGDPGAKGAKPEDQVVIEMVRFPTAEDLRGEAVITEVLGPRGKPGVDTLTIIRTFNLAEEFSEEALAEARAVAEQFDETDLDGRTDFTGELVVTIDPPTAHDFDDAVGLARDEKSGHWLLSVHIADVSHFVRPNGPLDKEARARGTSVYLPQRVLPMLPELISNALASLQEGRLRYVKSVLIEFTPAGERVGVRFANGAIRVRKRLTYEQVREALEHPRSPGPRKLAPEVRELLSRMKELAMTLRQRRIRRGALELTMPEPVLEYDEQGRVSGAHFAPHDVSHQIIEEFMLAANEAVAGHFAQRGIAILRRVHPPPAPEALEKFAQFARILGYPIRHATSRFELQRVLRESAEKPERPAVHFALLRSLKKAVYTPEDEEHYALAANDYCHFTSPIRRYPDLTVHRMLAQWLRRKKASSDFLELKALGEHCSRAERRAEAAERELVKLKLLNYLSGRLGLQSDAVVTGVADYGFYAQFEQLPAEGLVHISTLADDYYHYDEDAHTLLGRRTRRQYRLGDRVRVEVVRVDLHRRQLDLRVVEPAAPPRRRKRPAE
ncbi:MAG TPA: ribonuclease R [Gemmataceae bacterium]